MSYRSIVPSLLLATTAPAHAVLIGTYTTTGAPVVAGDVVSSTVTFDADFANDTLTVALRNLGNTQTNGSLLDGVLFNISGPNQALALSMTLNSGSTIASKYISKEFDPITTNQDISGSWQLGTPSGGFVKAPASFGYGLGGAAFSGAGYFAASALKLGGGGDDYTILGAATDFKTTNVSKGVYPLAHDTVAFTLTNFTADPSAKVTSVQFLYGSAPVGEEGGTEVIITTPEPGTATLALAALGLFGLVRRRPEAGAVTFASETKATQT